jgi:Curli production assembly/transport component CsgG
MNFHRKSNLAIFLILVCFPICSCVAGIRSQDISKGYAASDMEITLQANQPSEWYIDSRLVGRGRRLVVGISNQPHHIVAKAKGYKEKEEYINPPYSQDAEYSLFFMIEDKLDYKTAWGKTRQDLSAETSVRSSAAGPLQDVKACVNTLDQSFAGNVDPKLAIAVYGFTDKMSGRRMRMSNVLEDLLIQACIDWGMNVVNRRQLDAVLSEQAFRVSEIAAEDSLKIGELSGAHYVLSGYFSDNPSEGLIRIHYEITRVQDGVITGAGNWEIIRNASNIDLISTK